MAGRHSENLTYAVKIIWNDELGAMDMVNWKRVVVIKILETSHMKSEGAEVNTLGNDD